MKSGKTICQQLKAVRKRIAEENNIPLEIPECTHTGPCPGTCPRCEAEVQYLEAELEKRVRMGRVATVAGLAMTLAACGTGASNPAVDPGEDLIDGDTVFELMEDDTIPPPPPEIPEDLQLAGIIECEGFVVDTSNQPREMLEHLPSATEPLPDGVYDDSGTTASCNPLDEPVVRGESGMVTLTGTVRRRHRTKVLVPMTPQESHAEAERDDARRALPPVVKYDEVDGVKVINRDEQR